MCSWSYIKIMLWRPSWGIWGNGAALPYRILARWIRDLNNGRESLADVAQPVSSEAVATLLDTDRRHTLRELGQEIGLSHTTVLHILMYRLRMRKIASRWIPKIWQKHNDGYETTPLKLTWSVMVVKQTICYAVLLRWMRHGPCRTNFNLTANPMNWVMWVTRQNKTKVRRTPINAKVNTCGTAKTDYWCTIFFFVVWR